MKAKEFQKMTLKELQEKYAELQTQLIRERGQATRGTQSKNPHIIKNTRKNIARMMAIFRMKEEGKIKG